MVHPWDEKLNKRPATLIAWHRGLFLDFAGIRANHGLLFRCAELFIAS